MRRIRWILLAAAAALVAASVASASGSKPRASATLIVGGIHVGSVTDAGYNQAQHDGLMYLKSHLPGVKVIEASNVPESPQVQTTITDMIGQGAKLIFPMSFGYMDFALGMAKENPTVKFEQPAGYKFASNFGDYWAASTPINFALGAAAAKMSKTGKLGFVGAMPIPTVIATADAFHLGAQSVNPNATTTVIFTGSWSDPAKEAAAVNTMANQHIDVVATLVDSPITVVKTAEQRHIFAIGYHSAAGQKYAPNYWLSGVAFNWGPMFVQMAKQVMNGTWKSQDWVAPVKMGIAHLAPFGPKVPANVRSAATSVVNEFATGKLKSVFKGPVYNQAGKLMVKAGVQPSANFEFNVTWLAKGMIGNTK